MTTERLSIAIPLHNEEAGVDELIRRLKVVLDGIPGGPHEIVLVDDGSRDRTLERAQQLAQADTRIVVVSLSRNFGHQTALSAALDHVTGDIVVAMDGDLQDRPEAIPQLLAKHREGFDVVYARRVQRKEGVMLRASYFLFYRLLAWLADLRLPLDAGDFALMSRRVVDQMRDAPERHRYLRGLRAWVGFKQVGVDVERDERFAGGTNYGPIKLLGLAFDGILSFSVIPLRAAALLGVFAIAASFLFAMYILYERLVMNRAPVGYASLMLFMTFLAGVQLFFLGIIGEYIGRIYQEAKQRPLYVVASVTRRGASSQAGRHPERSEGPAFAEQIPRFARDDKHSG